MARGFLYHGKTMKKVLFIFCVLVVLAGIIGWQLYGKQRNANERTIITAPSEPTDFTASFEIYTNGTKRIFTAAMYHNQSPDVFIQSQDPGIVHVKKKGVTWTDFFETLPFALTKECLVTGTKQTFCTTETKKLRFFLNNAETPDALDLTIEPEDRLRVSYGD